MSNGSVVVYTKFERNILENLALSFPQYASLLQQIIDRFWDQSVIFKDHFIHSDFCGSYSLKSVLPTLVPTLRYENLDIQDGTEAQAVWHLMLNTINEKEKLEMIEQLKTYCKLDTLAMVEIHKVLCKL